MAEREWETITGRLTDTPQTLFHLLSSRQEQLCTPEDFSQALGRKITRKTIRQHVKNIRNELGDDGSILAVNQAGYFFSPLPPELVEEKVKAGEITLESLGALPSYSPEQEEQIRSNPRVNTDEIIGLINALNVVQIRDNEPFLTPRVTHKKRRLLLCLASGARLHSRQELLEATNISSPDSLCQHIDQLRKGLEPEGLTIYSQVGSGWLLAEKPSEDEPFKYPDESRDLTEKIKALTARSGTVRLHSAYLPGEESSQLAIDLLAYIVDRPNRCINKKQAFEEVLGGSFDYSLKANQGLWAEYLGIARKILKQVSGENYQLTSIRFFNKVILCQGKPGNEVRLPGLYDDVPSAIKYLLPQLERGRLKANSTIVPVLTPTESSILFQLGNTPDQFVEKKALEDKLWGDELYNKGPRTITQHLRNLTKKLPSLDPEIKIVNSREGKHDSSYALFLGK